MMGRCLPSRLDLRVVVPDGAGPWDSVEVRPFVDGDDLIDRAFDGPGADPSVLLDPGGPLAPTAHPHEVRLAEADCTEGCCGALYVTIVRAGDQVVWRSWRNPQARNVALPEIRFDAAQYDAELARAVADHSWEWPARTVARLVGRELRERREWLARWDIQIHFVSALPSEPDRIRFVVFHPGGDPMRSGRPWLQFENVLPVTAETPEHQAGQLVSLLTADDPRATGHVCGGSKEYADALGYPWPPPRSR